MSDSTAVNTIKKLEIMDTIKEGIEIGMKNIGPILVNILLWALTCWIPYLNVGTTIGLSVGIVSKASKGETIPFTDIFDSKYRKYMGEFFLTSSLIFLGVFLGTILIIIPGIVMCIAWSLSLLLVIDKGKNPSEAISLSNICTYGNKGRLFCIYFLLSLVSGIISAILMQIPVIGIYLSIILSFFVAFISIGIQASVYKRLTENV
jgi:hypothetical protein